MSSLSAFESLFGSSLSGGKNALGGGEIEGGRGKQNKPPRRKSWMGGEVEGGESPLSAGRHHRRGGAIEGGSDVAVVTSSELTGGKRHHHHRRGGAIEGGSDVAVVPTSELTGGKRHRRRGGAVIEGGSDAADLTGGFSAPSAIEGGFFDSLSLEGGDVDAAAAADIEGGGGPWVHRHSESSRVRRRHHRISHRGLPRGRVSKDCPRGSRKDYRTGPTRNPSGCRRNDRSVSPRRKYTYINREKKESSASSKKHLGHKIQALKHMGLKAEKIAKKVYKLSKKTSKDSKKTSKAAKQEVKVDKKVVKAAKKASKAVKRSRRSELELLA